MPELNLHCRVAAQAANQDGVHGAAAGRGVRSVEQALLTTESVCLIEPSVYRSPSATSYGPNPRRSTIARRVRRRGMDSRPLSRTTSRQ
jgi:hypothetical protein